MNINEKLKLLPNSPGCYLMKDSTGKIIYVGKAKNLKNRVKSYFTGSHNVKTAKLVTEIKDFEIVITNSEQESLILELNLIKENRPKYNIVFMDDKTYPFIQITNTTPPVIKVIRTKNASGKLFGPYPNVNSARATARLLELLFPMGRIEAIPNFYEEIGNVIENDTSNNYQKQVDIVTKFLKGDIKQVVDALTNAMNDYSEQLMFERAQVIKEQLEHIKLTTEKQIVSLNDYKDRDIVGIHYDSEDIAIQILFMRSGRIVDQHQMIFEYVGDPFEFIISYLNQFYEYYQPDELLFDNSFENIDLSSLNNVYIPKIGDKRKIVQLATKNAKYDLDNFRMLYRSKHETTNRQLDDLKELLEMESLDLIEVFDNSQLFGTAPISAMIVYENGQFNKKLYRKFHLKSTQNDDYMALREVIYRRYFRVLKDKLPRADLILVDGGKGHLKIANEVIDNLGLTIKVAGIKKDNNHRLQSLVLKDKEYNLKEYPEVFSLLFKISEEVHRYAIGFHRQTRKKVSTSSPLDNVKGLGSIRKALLLQHFDSFEDIYKASNEELLKLKLPQRVIDNLKEVLKNEINN